MFSIITLYNSATSGKTRFPCSNAVIPNCRFSLEVLFLPPSLLSYVFSFLLCAKNTVLLTAHTHCPHLPVPSLPPTTGVLIAGPFPRDVGLSRMKHSCSPHLRASSSSQACPPCKLTSSVSASPRRLLFLKCQRLWAPGRTETRSSEERRDPS